ncbi:hypothetical protein BO71DRAFT_427292 [Aspergillus ellipticus CBS 707.79]|uniref:Uncharacterized protein n=1 Tax=Aspergillus ellipticus CBS 707.79 TaxID=1448320 RepID=A0A319E926_9EURO|nr:hypothetical protein BO71DRAFT_427292 [Aspergillus ellipticus CBS 707.79]
MVTAIIDPIRLRVEHGGVPWLIPKGSAQTHNGLVPFHPRPWASREDLSAAACVRPASDAGVESRASLYPDGYVVTRCIDHGSVGEGPDRCRSITSICVKRSKSNGLLLRRLKALDLSYITPGAVRLPCLSHSSLSGPMTRRAEHSSSSGSFSKE